VKRKRRKEVVVGRNMRSENLKRKKKKKMVEIPLQ
jgi:hypothetical protein